MKTKMSLVLAGITALLFALSHATTPEPTSSVRLKVPAEEEIKQIERERNQALLKHDTATLDRMTSDDYTFINQRGELRTKTEILAGFKSGSFNYDAREVSDLKVRIYGDTAVVTGRAKQRGVENSKDYSGENRFTRVYVKQNGRWISVALQVTLVAKSNDMPKTSKTPADSSDQALERIADRSEDLLSMTSTLKAKADHALASGR
jgi:ketosteroid isomerase-like protein